MRKDVIKIEFYGKNQLIFTNISNEAIYSLNCIIADGAVPIYDTMLPLDKLEPNEAHESKVGIYIDSPDIFEVKVTWRDVNGQIYENSKKIKTY